MLEKHNQCFIFKNFIYDLIRTMIKLIYYFAQNVRLDNALTVKELKLKLSKHRLVEGNAVFITFDLHLISSFFELSLQKLPNTMQTVQYRTRKKFGQLASKHSQIIALFIKKVIQRPGTSPLWFIQ